jgi:hypothetical protein
MLFGKRSQFLGALTEIQRMIAREPENDELGQAARSFADAPASQAFAPADGPRKRWHSARRRRSNS